MKPTNYSARELIGIFDGLKGEKSTMDNHHQEINDYIAPSFSDVTQINETPGRKKGQEIYTGIGAYCINKLAKAMHAALTSNAAQWFQIRLSNELLMEDDDLADWFSEASDIQFKYMVASNFPNEIMKTYKALIGYGTACLNTDQVINERTKQFEKLKYETWHAREYVFSEGPDELPTMVMRLHRLTADKAYRQWAAHPRFAGFGQSVQAAFDSPDKRYKDRHDFLEVFFKRDIYEESKSATDWRNTPWGYCVVAYKDKKKIIQGGKMEQSPAIGRWEKNADDLGWGRSPSMEALPTIKTLNEIRHDGLYALKKDNNPPLVITARGVIGNVRTHAGGIIYKRKGAELEPLQSGSRYDAAQVIMEELRQEVKEHYMIDMIEMQPNTSNTLGEFQIRHEQMMRLLGPTYGRLTYDIFNPMLFRTFNILMRNGKFPAMPEKLLQIATNPKLDQYAQLDVQYTGPLARSQRSGEIDAIVASYNDAAMISQVKGTLDPFDHLDDDKAMELSMELRGVPAQVMRNADDVEKLREQRKQQMAQMQQTEQRAAEAEADNLEADAAGKVVNIMRGNPQ